jgi:hypothetical protein
MRASITLVGTSAIVGALLSLAITGASAAPIPVNNFTFEAVPPEGSHLPQAAFNRAVHTARVMWTPIVRQPEPFSKV